MPPVAHLIHKESAAESVGGPFAKDVGGSGEVVAANHLQAHGYLAGAAFRRRRRQQRVTLAWSTSLVSTVTTVAVQALTIPLVYRSLGQDGYAVYASITAAAGLISVLNLGIGGSLVTPIAAAAAEGNKSRQAMLVRAGLTPLILLCLIGASIVIPAVALLPLKLLLGKLGGGGSLDLRLSALIAASVALTAIPLSASDVLRQAFQEIHISNLLGAASNILLCAALLAAAYHARSLAVFVVAFTFPPLLVRVANCWLLISGRRYLLNGHGDFPWRESKLLLGDGFRYLSASFSNVLVYQWPVYWIARVLPPGESAPFAIFIQLVVFPLSFLMGFLRPMWSSAADAHSHADHRWLDSQIRRGRIATGLAGVVAVAIMFLAGQPIVRLWIRQPITMDWQTGGLIGANITVAMWEALHFVLALGLGRLREATGAVFQRAVAFSLAVPLLTALGGSKAVWCGMGCSILLWTAWRLPRLVRREMGLV